MRRLVIVVTATALVVAGGAWAVIAGTSGGRTPVSCMDSAWRTTAVSTSSKTWQAVPGMSRRPVAIFPIAINVSAQLSGAPVQLRVLATNEGGQTSVSKPGPVRFVPGSNGPNGFGYQWIERGNSGSPRGNFIRLQWRSPTGAAVHMQRADMSLLYATDGCQGSL